ncbi:MULTISPECIES: DUF2793 domain-containing protein [Alphaproteobacteria]|uniref:DUF2793 domain-containing protein n=2 Tax=Alphaproteobacteria TaxID=28211 RepID=A0A512HJI3_9HYPH|nr:MULTISPECIES: DUF2793 domain-containing protein [Alphaproteobacteria]GEO85618.1 hypothetical protein RNA01_25500 [Ciceribacter naphthalenivorans]GLR22027.1 hypothetical protein GCM10007920_18140 [Ciceribacter naphthalenivorans]GLT04883.1 hypothetical protein GCM10007926_18140 [Sphingomonas psychrolutea]
MSDTTVNLALPYIKPAQAQKHVTHNEALQALDAAVQLVLAARLTAPPASPAEGQCFWILPGATEDWAGREGRLAVRQDGAWIFIAPRTGWLCYDRTDQRLKVFTGPEWTDIPLPAQPQVSALGIAMTPNATNRLAVSAPASLFTHAGTDHRLKINKATASDTASLLFQSDWQGKAELGLAGDDRFAIKVSGDGGLWTTALAITPEGRVLMDQRPRVRAARTSGSLSPAAGLLTGFDDLFFVGGGFSLGAALASGHGHELVVPAAGTYLLALNVRAQTSSGHGVTLQANGTSDIAAVNGAAGTQSATAIASLAQGDVLTLAHSGTAQLLFGYGHTEINVVML